MSMMSPYYELAMVLVGLDPSCEVEYEDQTKVEEALYDKYGMDFGSFETLIYTLLPMITIAMDPLSGKMYKGFSEGYGLWLCKTGCDDA